MSVEELKKRVMTSLTTTHGFDTEEADKAIQESITEDGYMWHEEADADELANILASDETD